MIGFVFALAALVACCILVALLMKLAIRYANFPPESVPIAVVLVIILFLCGYVGGFRPW